MRLWVSGIVAAILLIASSAGAQESRRFGLEAGVVMGIIGVPYPTVGLVAAPWSVRVSGGGRPGLGDCHGLQINVGRVLHEEASTKHTVGAVWADFRNGCWTSNAYRASRNYVSGGRYFGLAYDFQVKGFFIEVGPAFGVRNPALAGSSDGLLDHVYGQMGYVHRFGKKYPDSD